MAKTPKKINIYRDKEFLLELEAIQKEKYGKRLMSTTIGRQTSKANLLPKNGGIQQQSSIDEDKSKQRLLLFLIIIIFIFSIFC